MRREKLATMWMCREDWRRQVPGGGGNFKALGCVTLNFKFFVSLWLQFFSTSPLQLTLIRKTYTHRCLEEVACVCVCVCLHMSWLRKELSFTSDSKWYRLHRHKQKQESWDYKSPNPENPRNHREGFELPWDVEAGERMCRPLWCRSPGAVWNVGQTNFHGLGSK